MALFLIDFRIKRYELLKNKTLPICPILDTQCQLWAKSRFGTCCTCMDTNLKNINTLKEF